MTSSPLAVQTPVGPAEVALDIPGEARSVLVLGHGAGGGFQAPDLTAVRDLALARNVAVARVTQPYRVAGRRSPAPAGQLDTAWLAVVEALRELAPLAGLPLVAGGRSSGARVACRTASSAGAVGLVALAFPLHPPGRPEKSRSAELLTGVPTIVVNGERDPFGIPGSTPGVIVEVLPGADHSLRRVAGDAARTAVDWLAQHGWAAAG
ncbi:MAG: alpha/beta hydrolase family protein [Micromonosporaceae bacterium]